MKRQGISLTTQVVILVSAMLLILNIVLGVFLIFESRKTMMELVNARMLDVSNTAAAFIDGDVFDSISREDVNGNTDEFKQVYDILRRYQENIDCDYIYSIRKLGEKDYVYVIDPDPEEPAEFGERFDYLPVLDIAFSGTPSIDEAATEDEWGSFYSSFSPIKNKKGEVVGIIGVDFNKKWVDDKVVKNSSTVIVSIVFSLIIGGIIVLLFTAGVRSKFEKINKELSMLSVGIEELTQKVSEDENYDFDISEIYEKNSKPKKTDEIEAIGARLHAMQETLSRYIEYMNVQAYTDKLTGARNSTAYYNFYEILNRKMKDGNARFAILLFDVNSLKCVNDEFGHEIGDTYVVASAEIMMKVLGKDKVFRLGGDEFVCIIEGIDEEEIKSLFADIDRECAAFNEKNETPYGREVAFSKGFAVYDPKIDKEYKDVFRRADFNMYDDKKEYYKKHPRE